MYNDLINIDESSFRMKFMNEPSVGLINFLLNDHECKILFII